MVSKCANPACMAPFRYLHEGRIFSVRSDSAETVVEHAVERYWLCSTCSDRMTLVLQRGKVTIRALAAIPEAGMNSPQCAQYRRGIGAPTPARSAVRAAKCVA